VKPDAKTAKTVDELVYLGVREQSVARAVHHTYDTLRALYGDVCRKARDRRNKTLAGYGLHPTTGVSMECGSHATPSPPEPIAPSEFERMVDSIAQVPTRPAEYEQWRDTRRAIIAAYKSAYIAAANTKRLKCATCGAIRHIADWTCNRCRTFADGLVDHRPAQSVVIVPSIRVD
jgi:hypothetical protein